MNAKTRKCLWISSGTIGLCVLLFAYKERDTDRCQVCFATKDVYQWRIGAWFEPSLPLSPKWERVAETHFRRDFLPANHTHQWQFAQGSPYYFLGLKWGGCAIGAGRHVSELCDVYESSEDFRKFIQAKLQDGSLTQSNLITLMSNPVTEDTSNIKSQSTALLDAFFDSSKR